MSVPGVAGGVAVVLLAGLLAGDAGAAPPPSVVGVELVSPHALPEARVRAALGPLAGRPRSREEVRASLARLWSLHLFDDIRVEEQPVPGGVRLLYHLARRPWVERVAFRGDLGASRGDLGAGRGDLALDVADVAAAAGLAIGGDASPERLARARQAVIDRYAAEGYPDARVDVETEATPASNARAVTVVVDAGARVRVGEVRVHEAARLGAETIRRFFPLEPGDRYRANAVRAAVEAVEAALRDRGFFEARVTLGQTRPHPRSGRIHLDLTVHEGPHARIEFDGVAAIPQPRLRERLTFADSRVVDEFEVRASARQIVAAYHEQGYAFAEATGTLTGDGGDRGDRVVLFRVVEGPRVTVADVTLTGDTGLPADALRERMETRRPGLLGGGHYRAAAIEQDVRVLQGALEARGFPDARVGPADVRLSDDRRQAHVTIPIDAGPRVTVGVVDVTGHVTVASDDVMNALRLEPGAPWSRAATDEARRALERLYARRGYHHAQVEYDARRRAGVVDVTFSVHEGEPTRIGRVLVSGLVLTRRPIVDRELPFAEGQPFDPDALVEAQRRLGTLGPFDRVDIEPLRPPAEPFADVHVTVRERPPWHVDFGLGYTTFEGARAFVELGHDNLFGTARTATFRQRVSERGNRTDLRYGEPRIAGTRWDGSAELLREERQEIGYDLERLGGALAVQRELFPERIRGLRTLIRYEIAQVDRFDVDRTLAGAEIVTGRERIATLTPELTLERRDRPLDPAAGSFHLLSLRAGDRALGSDASFLKARVESQWFFGWLRPTVVALSARIGLAGAYDDTVALPIEERFFAGGSTTVRGYRENRLGPLDDKGNPTGGNALAVFNAEWRFPIWRFLGGAVFVDTGAVASEVGRLEPGDLKAGIGGGLRVITPIGPLRIDVGYPLDTIPRHEREARIYLSVGHPF
jgi:outer membrane protein insertion porin family